MKTSRIIMAILIAITTVAAQDGSTTPAVKFGLRAGLNLGQLQMTDEENESWGGGSFSYSSDITKNTGNLIGFHVGAVVDVKILEFLYFQPGIMLSLKGGEVNYEIEESYSSSYSNREITFTMAPWYIDVPLMLSLKGTLANDLALRTHVGPYFGFGLFGKMEISEESVGSNPSDNYSEKEKVKNVFAPTVKEKDELNFKGMNRFNFGIGFGTGIEFSGFYLGVNYNVGLTNMDKDKDSEKTYERTMGITLGYNF